MEWRDLLIDGYNRVPEFMKHVLDGLSTRDCDQRPKPDTNSIGWLCWHLVRQQDAQVASMMGKGQLWTEERWHAKFNRPDGPEDSGFGQSPEQAAAFRSPEASVFIGYSQAVTARSVAYIRSLSEKDLERKLNEPWFQPLPTVGVRLVSILEDSMLHAGQAAYVRGLLQGTGWQKY